MQTVIKNANFEALWHPNTLGIPLSLGIMLKAVPETATVLESRKLKTPSEN